MTSDETEGPAAEHSGEVEPVQLADESVARVAEAVVPQVQAMYTEWSGPLPSPQDLQAYEDINTGFAERIMVLAEKRDEHRAETQKGQLKLAGRDLKNQEKANERGLKLGRWAINSYTVISFGFLAAAAYAFYLGNEWPGVALGAVPTLRYLLLFIREAREWVGLRRVSDS